MQVEDFDDRPPHHPEAPFLDRLSLRRVDRDIFTGWCHAGAPQRAFGGQVAAQALVAAGTTVEQPGRRVHSLHSYFLRPGRTTDHIVYQVDRPRDGRSFSTRRVRAVQYGETIFTMSASFAKAQSGPSHEETFQVDAAESWLSAIPGPNEVAELDILAQIKRNNNYSGEDSDDSARRAGFPDQDLIDLRFVPKDRVVGLQGQRWDRMAWIRTKELLPPDNLVQSCALTYFSDLTLVGTVLSHYDDQNPTIGVQQDVASIDHALWFHAPIRADEWVLFVTKSPISGGGHGFARGEFFNEQGNLIASAAQEVLVRDRPA
ncbi:MAG: thioesterase family protein [Actinomycetia bacterium]|nr:thioesterase family protein [Actinomycetes bacterium]